MTKRTLPDPDALGEVYYLSGVNPDGTVRANSYWGDAGGTAHKWGPPTAGTGATITYSFEALSEFTATEMDTFRMAFAMWEAVANVTFTEVGSSGDISLHRGEPGSGAYALPAYVPGRGSTLGSHTGPSLVNIDTTTPGFDLSGSFQLLGGYGISTAIHELGHVLGLGHGGPYNGVVKPQKQQESAYDTLLWSLMSYINPQDQSARYFSDYTAPGTRWNGSTAHTAMPLDILAMQQLYGAPTNSVLAGGQTFGFNSNIPGLLGRFFDFTDNTAPVVTLFSTGRNNTLDVSGFSQDATIRLQDGAFSSAGGLANNIGIAFNTVIETAVTGSGDDDIEGNAFANRLMGGAGHDTLNGGLGFDILTGGLGGGSQDAFVFDARLKKNIDTIADFQRKHDQILLDDVIFKGLGSGSPDGSRLFKGVFVANESGSATTRDLAQIVYETDTGQIYYDADGAGGKKAMQFAIVADAPKLTIKDFEII